MFDLMCAAVSIFVVVVVVVDVKSFFVEVFIISSFAVKALINAPRNLSCTFLIKA